MDVIHLHDWQAGPAAIFRDAAMQTTRVIARAAVVTTLHNLAYHGWTRTRTARPARAAAGDGRLARNAGPASTCSGRDRAGRDRQHGLPAFAARGADTRVRHGPRRPASSSGDRFLGILNGLDTERLGSGERRVTSRRRSLAPIRRARSPAARTCSQDGIDPADTGPVVGMIGRLDPQKGFDLLAAAAPTLLGRGARLVVQGAGHPELADPFRELAAAAPGKVALIERFDRDDGPAHLRWLRPLRDALALRAVRARAR